MMRRALIAACVVATLAGACRKPEAPSARRGERPIDELGRVSDDGSEHDNLLDITRGVTVVSRTGELSLDMSALFAIDGDPVSSWGMPPNDLRQSLILAFPARTRIEKVGLSNKSAEVSSQRVRTIELEWSDDGITFHPLATFKAAGNENGQVTAVTPVECSFLRATAVDAFEPGPNLEIPSLQARGKEVGPHVPVPLLGCWQLNELQAAFGQHGAHVFGQTREAAPTIVDGGTDGRLARIAWVRGNDFGLGLMTVSPDGKHLNGLRWHEEPIPLFFAGPWFGTKLADGGKAEGAATGAPTCAPPTVPNGAVFQLFLGRVGFFPLYGIVVDPAGAVDRAASLETLQAVSLFLGGVKDHEFQLVSHEYRGEDAAACKATSQHVADSLKLALLDLHTDLSHVKFVAAGSERGRQPVVNQGQRALYSDIELVPVRAAAR